jgi:hypothetical protein
MDTYAQVTESVKHPLIKGIVSTAAIRTGGGTDRQADKRLDLFLEGHYAEHNLSSALERARFGGDEFVRMQVWSAPSDSKPTFEEAAKLLKSGTTKPYRVGAKLGPSWTNHWVKVDITIPKKYRDGVEPVICESESCLLNVYIC